MRIASCPVSRAEKSRMASKSPPRLPDERWRIERYFSCFSGSFVCPSSSLEASNVAKELRSSWRRAKRNHPDSILYEVSRLELNSIYRKLKTKSAPGIDGLTNELLKNDKHYALRWIVQSLVNLSLTSRRFFDQWKMMVMTVVPKNKKDMSKPKSWRSQH